MALFLDVEDTKKRELLSALGLLHAVQNGSAATLEQWLQCARVHCLSKIESYFLQDASQLRQPLNLRNEAAAVSLLLAHWTSREAGGEQQQLLASLLGYGRTLWPELASGDVALSRLSTAGDSTASDGGSSAEAGRADGKGSSSSSSSAGLPGRPADAALAAAAKPPAGVPAPPGSPAADFEVWAREQGVGAAITIASFGALRGCAAARDVQPGEPLLSIPADVLIYEDSVRQTDLGRMLMAIPGLTIDNLLIIFTMIDRHDPDSKWARYWRSLPDKYYTGLSFPEQLVGELEGTAAHLELQRAQAHLRRQYADTQPLFQMLLQAYPQFLQPEWFDYDSYLWAAELWYSYAFEVQFPEAEGDAAAGATAEAGAAAVAGTSGSKPAAASKPAKPRAKQLGRGKGGKPARGGGSSSGKSGGSSGSTTAGSGSGGSGGSGSGLSSRPSGSSKPVMVPFACHVNHSPWPHCVRYGKVNPATGTLDYPAFRPCKEGQQVYISYGPVPNLKLLCYYGFVVPHNPHDLVPLLLEPPHGPLHDKQQAALQRLGIGLEHNLQDGPLSKQLLACLRVIVSTADELAAVRQQSCDPLAGPINRDNEEQALQTLQEALQGMLAPLLRLPLLAGGGAAAVEAGDGAGGQQEGASQAAAAAAAAGQLDNASQAVEQQQDGQQAEQQQPQQAQQADQPPQQEQGCNENGFDADWRMSRHFCRVYLEGQVAILRRSLRDCGELLAALQA